MDKWFGDENYVEDVLRKNKPLHYVLAFEVHVQCKDQMIMVRNNDSERDDKTIVIDDREVKYDDSVIELCDAGTDNNNDVLCSRCAQGVFKPRCARR